MDESTAPAPRADLAVNFVEAPARCTQCGSTQVVKVDNTAILAGDFMLDCRTCRGRSLHSVVSEVAPAAKVGQ
jgi:hypothetical protein